VWVCEWRSSRYLIDAYQLPQRGFLLIIHNNTELSNPSLFSSQPNHTNRHPLSQLTMKSHGHDHNGSEKMKAVEWEGKPFSVSVKSLPIPRLLKPQDAIIRCTSSGICGSDLHVFHGRIPAQLPMTLGHEIVGIVHSIGEQVQDLKVGDRVIVSAVINEDLLDGETELVGGLAFGTFPGIEQFNGGQAGFVRVPFATDNCILLPKGMKHELDYVFPTANWALDSSGFRFGDVVVVFGAGKILLIT
jgi:threonine dehydrogenase-like Zn-dependent dehydrogenase